MTNWRRKDVEKALKRNGYFLLRQNSTSHEIWYSNETRRSISIPTGKKEVNGKLWQSIVRDFGLKGVNI